MKKIHKLAIIGSGPAAHTASIYASRAQLYPVLYEGYMAGGVAAGGQLTTTTDVENYPGFPKGINGTDLMLLFREQSQRFGTEIITETVSKVDFKQYPFQLWTEGNEHKEGIKAEAVIIATGATAKKLSVTGVDQYWQKGISACAVCDGALPVFRNKELAVIGGGDSAIEEALFLTKYASKVYLLHRRDKLRASKIMQNRITKSDKIDILWNTELIEVLGNDKLLNCIKYKNNQTEKIETLSVNGLFFAIGHSPNTQIFQGQIELDSDSYILVKENTKTNIEGIFAAGDVQDKKYRQAITASGSGCMAALDAEALAIF